MPPRPEAGRRRVAELLERFDLVDAAKKPAATYSGGMRRRLDLAMTLVGDPRIIFLDEPTTGLDPRSRRVMWDIVRDLVAGGVTILLTTQYLEEADRLADRIALLDSGRIVAEGTPAELKRLVPGGHVRLSSPTRPSSTRRARALRDATRDDEAPRAQVPSDGGVRVAARAARPAGHRGHRGRRPAVHTPDLDDVFLALTGRPTASTRSPRHDHADVRRPRLGDDAPAQPAPHAPVSVADVLLAGMPVVFLLLFVYVFGGTLGAGLGGPSGGRADYATYVVPGILLITVAGGAQGTAISVAMDMTEGIIARFRTMAISRPSVLTGHVVGA